MTPAKQTLIFVAIASYKDPLLERTVAHAIRQATHKDRLRFGIVDQSDTSARWDTIPAFLQRMIRYLWIDPAQSRGACYARAMTYTLYAGEPVVVQLDAHMAFPPGWDEWVVETLMDRMAVTPQCVVSSYPPSMQWVGDEPVIESHAPGTVIQHRVHAEAAFHDGQGIYLNFEGVPTARQTPILGHHLSAGVILAPGTFIERFPYDPQLYYLGEEQLLALRLYTHGWSIWHPLDNPIGHRYNEQQEASIRPVHWADDPNRQRPISHDWWQFRAYQRQRLICEVDGFGGVYGLGTARSLADYAEWTGIDYRRRTVDKDWARRTPTETI